jgi:hypothetical protein
VVKTEAVSPEQKQHQDFLLLSCVAAVSVLIFGKFTLDIVGIVRDRKRRPSWPYDYTDTVPPKDV